MVYVTSSSNYKPAAVQRFLCVSVLLEQAENAQVTVYLANINWLLEHNYKNFFGHPVEVWSRYIENSHLNSNITYVAIACISTRCAYVHHKVQFTQSLCENVTIVIPLDHFTGIR